jgi:hypothetical protein
VISISSDSGPTCSGDFDHVVVLKIESIIPTFDFGIFDFSSMFWRFLAFLAVKSAILIIKFYRPVAPGRRLGRGHSKCYRPRTSATQLPIEISRVNEEGRHFQPGKMF